MCGSLHVTHTHTDENTNTDIICIMDDMCVGDYTHTQLQWRVARVQGRSYVGGPSGKQWYRCVLGERRVDVGRGKGENRVEPMI